MDRFIFKAMTTWGEVDDFKHFLPRILELLAMSGEDFPEVFLVGSKLVYGKLEEWPQEEQFAVKEFLKAWWRNELASIESDCHIYEFISSRIDQCLECIAKSLNDIGDFLEIWLNDDSIPALRHLSHFIFLNHESLTSKKELDNLRWNELSRQPQIINFLLDDRTLKKIETAFYKHSNECYAFEFSEAEQKLQWIRSVFKDSQSA